MCPSCRITLSFSSRVRSEYLAWCKGRWGAQDILRRCVITAPQLALNYDAAATHYDNIRIAPGTYSTMRFKLEGYFGDVIDLQGQEWSFSIVIFPRD